jgi:hypothetical protein
MIRTLRVAAVAGGFASILSITAALAGPSMAAKASPTKLTLDACKQRAQEVAKKANFKISKVLPFSVYAERDSYAVIVRCSPEQGVVFFAVAGPRMERCASYVDEIGDDF